MPRTYLNRLITADRQLPTPTPGVWRDDQAAQDFLANFAHDIDVGGDVADASLIHSAPSVFARPILFEQGFNDATSPVHQAVIDEWRGLLGVLALQSWRGYRLDLVDYPLPAGADGLRSFVGNIPGGSLHLDTMLRSQLPAPSDCWNPLKLIHCNGVLVGAASPWTMVFTPAKSAPPESISWSNGNGVLYDPIKRFGKPGRTSIDLTLIYHWAQSTRDGFPWGLNGIVTGNYLNGIQRELSKWIEELSPFVDERWTVPGLSPALANAGPFQQLLRTSFSPRRAGAVGGAEITESDLFIRTTQSIRNVIALKRRGLDPTTRVINAAFAADIDIENLRGSSGESLTTRGGAVHRVDWVIAEEVFLSKAVAQVNLDEKTAMVCGTGDAKSYSLPLTPRFFEYFTHATVAPPTLTPDQADTDVLTTVVAGDGDYKSLTARLRIPLRNGGELLLEHSYPLKKGAIAEVGASTPGFALWPDFYAPDWTHNFAAFNGPFKLDDARFTVAPLFDGGTTGAPSRVDTTERETRIWNCSRPPLGFALSSNGIDAGIVLRRQLAPASQPVSGRSWRVSLDFGTANTMIAYQQDAGKTQTLPLKARLLLLNRGDNQRMELISNTLYPREGAVPPFRTLLYRAQATFIGQPGDAYTLRFVFSPTDLDDLVSNLKWGGNAQALKDYLDGIVRYIACEARAAGVTSLIFKWSYPLSLPEASHEAMTNFWTVQASSYSIPNILSVTVGDPTQDDSEAAVSESEGTCRAIGHYDRTPVTVMADGLAIALDVGGGSTDFAFWSGGNLLDQFSFKLAGNDVLCGEWTTLANYLDTIHWLSLGTPLDAAAKKLVGNQAEIYVNFLLSQARSDKDPAVFDGANPLLHPAVLRIFGTKGQPKELPLLPIRTLVYLLFGGISYFAGLCSRTLKVSNSNVTVCFGGRGASLLAWMSNNPELLKQVLQDFFVAGLRRDAENSLRKVKIVGPPLGEAALLPRLKEEVSLGMLQKPLGKAEIQGEPPIGEINWRDGADKPVNWDATLTAAQVDQLHPPAAGDDGNCYIKDFLYVQAGQQKHAKLNIDIDGIKKLTIDWDQIQNMVRMDILNTGVSQPVFACELKALMKQYVQNVISSLPAHLT
jgi:hypothetical protein